MRNIQLVTILTLIIATPLCYFYGRSLWMPIYNQLIGHRSIDNAVQHYATDAEGRLKPYFKKAGVDYPPSNITLLAIKNERRLELWANDNDKPKLIRAYAIKAASGDLGPKLREGDKQVPEGIYTIEYLNPNSAYHLSMKLNYPNAFDKKHAAIEGRDNPGSNIFIHGKSVSIGCLAMGDSAIEELFVLVTKTGLSNVKVGIAPADPRLADIQNTANKPWVNDLYLALSKFFKQYTHE